MVRAISADERWCPPFTPMHRVLQPCAGARFAIEHFTMTREEVDEKRAWSAMSFQHAETYDLAPGTYVRLLEHMVVGTGRQSLLWTTDTPMERRTSFDLLERARGRLLIGGLGIGMVVVPLLAKPEVTEVVVVEREQGVIDLVLPQLLALPGSEKLHVRCGDATERPPKGDLYDGIWFDIWPNISADNWEEMKTLHRQFRRHLTDNGWVRSWRQKDCQRAAALDRQGGWGRW
jgi:hypothetical protein